MLELIRRFYDAIKNEKAVEVSEEEPPLTHVKVFHKAYPRFARVKLQDINDEGSQLEDLLNIRKSTRSFSDVPLSLKDISKILHSCRIVDIERDPEKRTYPSGGARFPVELYLINYNINDLNHGAYHYNMVDDSLELLLEEDLKQKRRDLISPFLDNPAATLIFTSVISRSEVKYGARAYPYSLLEAGHMGQNIQLACAEIGIGCCSVSGFIDKTVKEILDLDNEELPIYSISLGWKKV